MFLNSALYTRAQAYDPIPGLGDEISETMNYKRFVYDATVQSGAIGTAQLLDEQGVPALIPTGSLITLAIVQVITAAVGTGASIALNCNGTADLLAATAITSFTAAAKIAGIPVGTAATAVLVNNGTPNATLARRNFSAPAMQVTATISAAALTAGRFYVHVMFARSALT